ncbi:glycosyltransferase family 2 protein [Seonamhaeicola aphaedonensis]|uniref:GT2 family glycosyltransferase n=1 Tax=Seonamhaeicola aphaedonensis TaxID=1461338 RepID=A0A3D9HHE9_9FLAO|nr:glycosyltransferase [Seonamhaeicola aphaedonensis]RED48939.1 GT2 family glycosyltransferase [Seonamhaeicola aphaedonensis]
MIVSKKPAISVVIPLYNKEKVIARTVATVLNQSFDNFELVIVDDGSSDHSLEIVKKIEDNRIIIYEKENGGVSNARNYGVKRAKGEWIFLLDADDELYNNAFETLFNLVNKYEGKSVYIANFCVSKGDRLDVYCKERSEGVFKYGTRVIWLNKVFSRTGNTLLNKNIFEDIGYFREDLSYYEDMEFILKYAMQYEFVYSPIPIFVYKKNNSDLSVNSRDLDKEYAYHATFKNFNFYAKMIIGKIVFFSIQNRFKNNNSKEAFSLLKKHFGGLFYIVFSVFYSKILKVDK